jgi:DNA-binding NarL/FixJ family response regulator
MPFDYQLALKGAVVDDHPAFRSGIAALLATQPDMKLVAQASNGHEAIQQFRAHCPDVTLMDLQMPEMSGDSLFAIRGEFSDARIIVLTTYQDDVRVLRAMEAGARAYLAKNLMDDELLGAVRDVHAGKRKLPAEPS